MINKQARIYEKHFQRVLKDPANHLWHFIGGSTFDYNFISKVLTNATNLSETELVDYTKEIGTKYDLSNLFLEEDIQIPENMSKLSNVFMELFNLNHIEAQNLIILFTVQIITQEMENKLTKKAEKGGNFYECFK